MANYYLDIETYEYNGEEYTPILDCNKFTCAYLMDEKGKGKFYDNKEELKEDIIKITEKNNKYKRRTIIYAHNAQYEYLGIWKNEILKGEFKEIRSNPLITKHKTGFMLLDTMAIINERLEIIGEKIGHKKGTMPQKIRLINELEEYNKQDCEICRQLIIYIKKNLEEMNIKIRTIMTTPQISVNAFIQHLIKTKEGYDILEIKNGRCEIIKSKYDKFLRNAYHLGRNTVYQSGIYNNVTLIDQNRQFPYSSTIIETPNLRQEYYMEEPLEKIKEDYFYENYIGVCLAKVKIENYQGIGILPYTINNKVMFLNTPNTEWEGYWTIQELNQARKEQHKIKITKAVFYKKSKKNPFISYMNELYEIEKKNPEKKMFIKLLQNGLIGKFGAQIKNKDRIIDIREKAPNYIHEGYEIKGEINENFVYEKTESETIPTYSNVMLAIHITSTARIQMYKHLKKIKTEDLIYTDTDSIIMKNFEKYKEKFKFSQEMGTFKIEIENADCEIRKEKCYKIGNKIHIAGLSKKEQDEDVFQRIDNGLQFNMKLITINEALKSGKITEIGKFQKEKFSINKEEKEDEWINI